MAFLTISVDSKKFDQKVKQLAKDMNDWTKPLTEASNDLIGIYGTESIKTQGAAVGERWKGLSQATLMARSMRTGYYKKSGSGTSALLWTGRLSKGFVKKVAKFVAVVSNKVPYFEHHQAPSKPGRPPQRKMISMTTKIENGIMNTLNKYLTKIINK